MKIEIRKPKTKFTEIEKKVKQMIIDRLSKNINNFSMGQDVFLVIFSLSISEKIENCIVNIGTYRGKIFASNYSKKILSPSIMVEYMKYCLVGVGDSFHHSCFFTDNSSKILDIEKSIVKEFHDILIDQKLNIFGFEDQNIQK